MLFGVTTHASLQASCTFGGWRNLCKARRAQAISGLIRYRIDRLPECSVGSAMSSGDGLPNKRVGAGRRVGLTWAIPQLARSRTARPSACKGGWPWFSTGGKIPKGTCNGQNTSPQGVPANAESFLVVCDDPDASGGAFQHWGAYNIPADWTGLKEAYSAETPCPPHGHRPHAYHFRLSALSTAIVGAGPAATCDEIKRLATPYETAFCADNWALRQIIESCLFVGPIAA